MRRRATTRLAIRRCSRSSRALLFFGSALGAGGGFIYGQLADLTPDQATFLGNAVLLGTATAALVGIAGSKNGDYDNWENGTLAVGLDATSSPVR